MFSERIKDEEFRTQDIYALNKKPSAKAEGFFINYTAVLLSYIFYLGS